MGNACRTSLSKHMPNPSTTRAGSHHPVACWGNPASRISSKGISCYRVRETLETPLTRFSVQAAAAAIADDRSATQAPKELGIVVQLAERLFENVTYLDGHPGAGI